MNHVGRSFMITLVFLLMVAALLTTPQGRTFTAALSQMSASLLGRW